VWWDDRGTADRAAAYLSALGHRRIGYVADRSVHARLQALRDGAAAHRVDVLAAAADADRVSEVARVTRSLLSYPHAPTALVYDSAVGAATALGVACEMAVRVPRSLSVLAWQDWPLCGPTRRRITAMTCGTGGLGGHAVRVLLALLDHRAVPSVGDAALRPVHRDSVAPPG
jgi:DNA-binding LacI/PurR family transcriptional regulator